MAESNGAWVNPLLRDPSPDPFVLKHRGRYWAFCTGFAPDGRAIPVFSSPDLLSWRQEPGALPLLSSRPREYWAPEVFYANGVFHLYYSAGDGLERMAVRVATSAEPAGPYEDRGIELTLEPFAIDAHVFEDEDGSRWLFYATDFPKAPEAGTGTVCDRMIDPFRLAGAPRPVTLPRFDWHVYDPCRAEKGGVRWHTVEGPFVLKRKGIYYEMYSGGNWSNPSYGIGYATTARIGDGAEWHQACDGIEVPPILRTIPGRIVGPGHNSVVRGPDNRELYCIYHRWDPDGAVRVACMDRMDWAGDRLLVLGPTGTPQPAPLAPAIAGFSGDDPRSAATGSGAGWSEQRGFERFGDALRSGADAAVAACRAGPSFVMEVTAQRLEFPPGESRERERTVARAESPEAGASSRAASSDGAWLGAAVSTPSGPRAGILLSSGGVAIELEPGDIRPVELPWPFDPRAEHLLRIEADERDAALRIDGHLLWRGLLPVPPDGVLLQARCPAAFAAFALSEGWDEEFLDGPAGLTRRGWRSAGSGEWEIGSSDGAPPEALRLRVRSGAGKEWRLLREGVTSDTELVVSARLLEEDGGGWGVIPAVDEAGRGVAWFIRRGAAGWVLAGGERTLPLPAEFDPGIWQQLRWRREGARAAVSWNGRVLGTVEIGADAARVGIACTAAEAAFDCVRLSRVAIPSDGTDPAESLAARREAGAR